MSKNDDLISKAPKQNNSSHRGPNFGNTEKAKDFKGTMKRLMAMLSRSKVLLIVILIFTVLGASFAVIGPRVLGEAITSISTSVMTTGRVDFDALNEFIVKLIILYVCSLGFSLISGFALSSVAQRLTYDLREDLSKKINKMPLKYFDNNQTGDTISRITNDVDTIATSLNQSLPQILNSIVTFIGTVYMMLSINVSMALISFLIIPVSMTFVMFVIKKSQKYFKEQQKLLGKVNGHIEEAYSGINVIKSNCLEEESIQEFEKSSKELAKVSRKAQFISSLLMPIMGAITNIAYVVVAVFGAYYVSIGVILIGDIVSFTQYIRTFMQPLGQISQASTILQSTAAAAERVFAFIDEEEEEQTQTVAQINNIKGNVKFQNIKFGYNEDKTIINDFSCEIYSGRKIAIIGPTGAGKTTILKLLMRYYDVQSGDILIDDQSIKDFSRKDLRSLFGIVLQDTWLFSGTILDNIKFGKPDATLEEVQKACKLAHIHHYIMTLPEGYNTVLNEESSNISEGQKQLLTIARAVLSNPSILILDEATSSVDTRTEKLIQEATYNLMQNRTSFVIAHRLSTIIDSDLILVMNNGDIVETGNHKELLKEKGFYYELYNSQFATE